MRRDYPLYQISDSLLLNLVLPQLYLSAFKATMLGIRLLLAGLLVAYSFGHEGHSDSNQGYVQHCQSSLKHGPNFCISATSSEDPSTAMLEFLLTIQIKMSENSASGWTAIGLGDIMDGALMAVIYGDSASGNPPVVSIRSTKGHAPPRLISSEEAGGAVLDVRHAAWSRATESRTDTALVNLACSNCTYWPGTKIDLTSKAQPWIWAWNPRQEFEAYPLDAPLQHHGSESTDFGHFYFDMTQAVNKETASPPFPPILPSKGSIGASTDAADLHGHSAVSSRERAWILHGTLMGFAFLVLSPAGVIALRSPLQRSFQLHWALQLSAGICFFLGALLALLLHPEIVHVHQGVGLFLCFLAPGQAVLGWRHHVTYLRIRRRTWLSNAHVWTGRLMILPLGMLNILSGMLLRNVGVPWIAVVATLIITEAACLIVFLRRAALRRRIPAFKTVSSEERLATFGEQEAAFALEEESEDDDTELQSGRGRGQEKQKLVNNHASEEQ